jgi:hypothetical protein
VEASRTVTQVGASAPTAIVCPLLERLMDLFASMRKICQSKGVMNLALLPLFDAHQGDARRLAAWIEFQSHRL